MKTLFSIPCSSPTVLARLLAVLFATASAACSSADAGAAAPSSGGPTGVQPATWAPVFHFVDGAGRDVTSIYYLDPIAVKLTGLVPGRTITVRAEMAPWVSQASFVVGADGVVDLGRDAPSAGTYTGVDPDGLFWSMDSKKFEYAKSANVELTATEDGSEATEPAKATLKRTVTIEGMRSVIPDDPSIVGKLFLPPGAGPFPAILAFGGSEGGLDGGIGYAEELVPRGYAVLSVAYFAEKGLPSELASIPLEYFSKALSWLGKQNDVDGARLGVIGGSRGGELSLLLASAHPELRAAIADVPSGYVWGAVAGKDAAWTNGGTPLPFVPSAGAAVTTVTTPEGEEALVLTPTFLESIAKASSSALAAARIPVERSNAAIAMFAGGDDQLWPSCQLAKVAMDQLQASGHAASHPDELTCFEGAGHSLTSVGLPTTHSSFASSPRSGALALGGTPQGNARAGRMRQRKVAEFLAKAMKR